ncbi:MAG TPA: glycosyltransferase [Flavobacterium sp.]|nr:glycosyltransferase [Flavobacterium sp.]
MLSILIPTYNYCIYPLVLSLYEQAKKSAPAFEIICLDDASAAFHHENQLINGLENCSYSVLSQNIGRSAIRNLLAKEARFDNLLFLDADVALIDENFIAKYVSFIDGAEKVVYGGICYQEEEPEKSQALRWVYGRKREALSVQNRNKNKYLSFLTLNFMIKKSVFQRVSFNETIPNLRHEDTLFSFDLKKAGIEIIHIDNAACHLGLESSAVFLRKSEEAVAGLAYLIENNLIDADYVKLARCRKLLVHCRLDKLYAGACRMLKSTFKRNLLGSKPSLAIFDLFRLGYFCDLKTR